MTRWPLAGCSAARASARTIQMVNVAVSSALPVTAVAPGGSFFSEPGRTKRAHGVAAFKEQWNQALPDVSGTAAKERLQNKPRRFSPPL